jgi:hypothetical protein
MIYNETIIRLMIWNEIIIHISELPSSNSHTSVFYIPLTPYFHISVIRYLHTYISPWFPVSICSCFCVAMLKGDEQESRLERWTAVYAGDEQATSEKRKRAQQLREPVSVRSGNTTGENTDGVAVSW